MAAFIPGTNIEVVLPDGSEGVPLAEGSKDIYPPEAVAQLQVQGFDARPVESVVEPFKSGRSFTPGWMFGPRPKRRTQETSAMPNRKERRARLASAPREIRQLVLLNRETYKFAHKAHPLTVRAMLDPEQQVEYDEKWTDEDKLRAKQSLRWMRRRLRQGRGR